MKNVTSHFASSTFCNQIILFALTVMVSAIGIAQIHSTEVVMGQNIKIHNFNKPSDAPVESILIEDENGIILIDAQRTTSAGKEIIKTLRSIEKPLYAIIITHPHPDHVGGLPTILEEYPNTPVLGTKETDREMKTDSIQEFSFARRVNGDEYPKELALPTRIITHGETLKFGTITLMVEQLGPGESIDMNCFYAPDLNALFVGDLLDNDRLGFMLEKRTGLWLQQINALKNKYGKQNPLVFPGHGDPAQLKYLVKEQKKWLTSLRKLVKNKMVKNQMLNEAAIDQIIEDFTKKYPIQIPVAPIPDLMKLNIKAIEEELKSNQS